MRRLRRSPLAAAPLAVALLLAACVTNPVTGRSEFTLMSPERETALGQQAAEQVEREIGLVDAPELTAYVERLGQRLARSVRPLRRAERDGLKVRRLRIVRARRGESLAVFSSRTGNVWSVAETAIANALPQQAELARGELVKIAVEVPYAG